MTGGNGYRDLVVWQKSMDLVVMVYALAKNFPKDEVYGLVSQIRRAVVSLPSNIAEGKLRGTGKDFRQFLIVARASGAEVETQIEIACRLGYVSKNEVKDSMDLLEEIMRMLSKLIASLTNS